MREIKFKYTVQLKDGVWLHECFDFSKHMEWVVPEWIKRLEVNYSDIHKRQYTGLKDKNGNPIFEGDILNAHAEKAFRKDSKVSDVIYGECGAWQLREIDNGDHKYLHGLPLNWGGWESLEIIGNIYENGDLLDA